MSEWSDLEKKIGYKFKEKRLFKQALSHSSYASTSGEGLLSNERMEFLGDAVLGLIVSQKLFHSHPGASEGQLTRLRASLVNAQNLAQIAQYLDLASLIRFQGEKERKENSHILSNCLEALLGAIYLDGGIRKLGKVIDLIVDFKKATDRQDFKTRLQEWTQKKHSALPVYSVEKEEGPEHEKQFEVSVKIVGKIKGRGTGKNKKEAEQNAAQNALIHILEKKES